MKAIKGNIIHSKTFGALEIIPHGYIVYDERGIQGIYDTKPNDLPAQDIEDYGDALIIPSFSDMHLHAPQYAMLGMGMDLPLLDWLNTYTFPTEAHFKDLDLARKIYHDLASELVRNGTTRVCMFSSLHVDATLVLMDELEKAGIVGYVGKVNMDRNGGVDLQEETEESIQETLRWIEASKQFKNIHPIITPRFTPSCTNELMAALGEIAKNHDLPIQSHLSENVGEIAWVKELHPDCLEYWETYQKYGLWNQRTLMAHCVHSSERELQAIKDAGVYVVHCSSSNENLISGYASVRHMLNQGVKVVLGSDIAGGDHLSMFDNVTAAIRASKARQIMDEGKNKFLTVEEAFYLATSAPAEFFNEAPGFEIGNPLHALILNDEKLLSVRPLDLKERFERVMYRGKEEAIIAVYSNNKKIR